MTVRDFRVPEGVRRAEAMASDPALILHLTHELSAAEAELADIEADNREQAQIVARLHQRVNPKLKFIATFADPDMPFVVISTLCGGLAALGKEVVMAWQGDPKGQYWLTVSVIDDEAAA